MSPRAQAAGDESQFIDGLRTRFEREGFRFIARPEPGVLPDFLGTYLPDAIAQKPGHNVAIQVKRTLGHAPQRSLESARRLFEGHPDWQFHVFFMGDEAGRALALPQPDPAALRAGCEEARALAADGHPRAAFVLAWSNLEAALRLRIGGVDGRPRGPGTLVQALAMNGLIESDTERNVRSLIDLRDRIVHGDLTAAPTAAQVEEVLSAVDETLRAETA